MVCHRHTIAEQPVGGGILAYCFRSLLQVVCTGFLIGGGERLGIQFLGLLAVVVEVVVGRGPLVEVVAFGVVHQRKFIVAVGVHVLQPCGEFHVVDAEINADFGELATQLVAEFRAVRVGVGEGEFQRIIGGIAGFSHEFLGFVHIVRVQVGQVLIARVHGWDRPAERIVDVTARSDDFLMVDAVTDCLTHALVGKLAVRAVEGEHVFVAAVRRGHLIRVGVKRFGERGVHRGKHVDFAAFQRVDGCVIVGEEFDDHVFGCGLACASPILRVGFERHFAGGIEGFHRVRARSDGFGFRVVFGVLIEHQAGASGQVPQQVGIGGAERELHGVAIDRFGFFEAFDLIGVVILLFFELVNGPGHIFGVQRVSVGEVHVLVEMERIRCAVVGNIPAFRQSRLHFVVGIARQQPFVHIADQHLFDRRSGLVTNVETYGGEFQSNGHGVGGAIFRGIAGCVVVAEHDDAHNDGDHCDHCNDGDDPLVGPLGFR